MKEKTLIDCRAIRIQVVPNLNIKTLGACRRYKKSFEDLFVSTTF